MRNVLRWFTQKVPIHSKLIGATAIVTAVSVVYLTVRSDVSGLLLCAAGAIVGHLTAQHRHRKEQSTTEPRWLPIVVIFLVALFAVTFVYKVVEAL